jgi:hypothetical protein
VVAVGGACVRVADLAAADAAVAALPQAAAARRVASPVPASGGRRSISPRSPTRTRSPTSTLRSCRALDQRHGCVAAARVGHRLAAAGLVLGIVDLDAEALEQLDHGHPDLRITLVDVAGDEQAHLHAAGSIAPELRTLQAAHAA